MENTIHRCQEQTGIWGSKDHYYVNRLNEDKRLNQSQEERIMKRYLERTDSREQSVNGVILQKKKKHR